jgi:MFS family permease
LDQQNKAIFKLLAFIIVASLFLSGNKIMQVTGDWIFLVPVIIIVLIISIGIKKVLDKPLIMELVKKQYHSDIALQKAIKVDYKVIVSLIILAIIQFYLSFSTTDKYDGVQFSYFGILFFTSTLGFVPDAANDRNMGRLGAIFLTIVFSIFILGLYIFNPTTEILYIIVASYINLAYHLLFADGKQIERNTTRGGCMVLIFVLLIVITTIISINSNLFINFSKDYNMYYFFNGIYFLAASWIEYTAQKQT